MKKETSTKRKLSRKPEKLEKIQAVMLKQEHIAKKYRLHHLDINNFGKDFIIELEKKKKIRPSPNKLGSDI